MDLAQIRELLKIVAESGVAEVEVEEDEFKLIIRKNAPSVMVQSPMYAPYGMGFPMPGYGQGAPAPHQQAPAPEAAPAAPPPPAQEQPAKAPAAPAEAQSERELVIKAPIVGTFYRAAAPGENSFVEVGDDVDSGDVLCIIEAMKLMNEIESEVKGSVKRILVEDAQAVEYDQPLFIIETA